MAKVTVEVLDAVVDGKRKGEKVEIDERSAKAFESLGYVKILPKPIKKDEDKPKETPKAKAKPKKKATPKGTSKKESKDK